MSSPEAVGFFEAFNAKYLEPEQVASGFVYSRQFEELAGPYHAVLIGPRGSGKTTLLKMLHPAALETWAAPRAEEFRRKIDYSGVFISSDISWSRQLTSLGYGKLAPDVHRIMVLACFTTHVLHATLQTMLWRTGASCTFKRTHLSAKDEESLAAQLALALSVSPVLNTLLSVKQALRQRLSYIRQLANSGSLTPPEVFAERVAADPNLHLDFLDAASNITSAFNDMVGEPGGKWALLFDELETAPDWIISQLFTSFRVSDPKMYLKLAISPVSATAYEALKTPQAPSEGHDHRQIRLWYSDRIDAKSFCDELWNSLTSKAGLNVSARDALGASSFEPLTPRELKTRNPYSAGQYWNELFRELEKKDRSFAAFLRARQIDLDSVGKASQHVRDAVLRRAAPIAAVRNFYLHKDNIGNVTPKQRKTSVLYAGAESIFAISEGNPRWLIGILSPLIAFMVNNNVRRVPQPVQADEIDQAAGRLLALLRTTPVPARPRPSEVLGLHQIAERIGTRLHDDLMTRNFSLDPRLCFRIDPLTPPGVVDLLSVGLNRGAVMLVDNEADASVIGALPGTTLRLSYLLAAKYGLPLRKGKSVLLSTLLHTGRQRAAQSQPELDMGAE